MLVIATPVLSYAQQQPNYVATLRGKDMVPPVNTHAIGVARFHMNPDGSLCYSVDVYHIAGVLGAHIGTKNGTELADLATGALVKQRNYYFPFMPSRALPASRVSPPTF
jgi:hypothetical protein